MAEAETLPGHPDWVAVFNLGSPKLMLREEAEDAGFKPNNQEVELHLEAPKAEGRSHRTEACFLYDVYAL